MYLKKNGRHGRQAANRPALSTPRRKADMNRPTGIIPGYMRERIEDYRRKQAQAKKGKSKAGKERPSGQPPVASGRSQKSGSGKRSRGKK
jgi:hypothetical protein